jgi:hypothetical protein
MPNISELVKASDSSSYIPHTTATFRLWAAAFDFE